MFLAKVTSPGCDDFVSLGKTKKQAIAGLIDAYKGFYNYSEETLKEEHNYDSFEQYFDDFLGVSLYEISVGESIVCGYDVHYKNGERVRE